VKWRCYVNDPAIFRRISSSLSANCANGCSFKLSGKTNASATTAFAVLLGLDLSLMLTGYTK
jgi:hypothetical protein